MSTQQKQQLASQTFFRLVKQCTTVAADPLPPSNNFTVKMCQRVSGQHYSYIENHKAELQALRWCVPGPFELQLHGCCVNWC